MNGQRLIVYAYFIYANKISITRIGSLEKTDNSY